MKKIVIYFGSYHLKYSRNILTKKAFTNLGWKIIDCQDNRSGLAHYYHLTKRFIKNEKKTDLIFIGVIGHFDLPLAWVLAKIFRKKIIFDCFYSLYDTYVNDRKTIKTKSWQARRFYFYDWISVTLADKVIMDTQENINYVVSKYKVKSSKFSELPISADPDVFKFKPPKKHRIFCVGFYGSFMPLHGVEIIIQAANILKKENINFYLAGDGPGLKNIEKKVKILSLDKKVKIHTGLTPYEQLPSIIENMDLLLAGPFGDSGKASRVITAKTAEALSIGLPVVVAKTKPAKRLLGNYLGEIIWVSAYNARELADAIKSFQSKKFSKDKINYFLKSELAFNKFQNKFNKILYQ